MSLAPIVIFVYNRPWHIKQTIEALKKNLLAKQSELFIFSDGPVSEKDREKVSEVRKYIKMIGGFKKIIIMERKKNFGLAGSIIAGVTEIVNRYGKVIVLEDDLLTSRYFLKFMNDGLDFYKNEKRVLSIHGYVYPVSRRLPNNFFLKDPGCLGWATWRRGWNLFKKDGKLLLNKLRERKLTNEFDYNGSYAFTRMLENQIAGEVDCWAVRWYASVFLSNGLVLYPGTSLVFHNGGDGSGVHGGIPNESDVKLANSSVKVEEIKIEQNMVVCKEFEKCFRKMGYSSSGLTPLLIYGVYRPFKRIIKRIFLRKQ